MKEEEDKVGYSNREKADGMREQGDERPSYEGLECGEIKGKGKMMTEGGRRGWSVIVAGDRNGLKLVLLRMHGREAGLTYRAKMW